LALGPKHGTFATNQFLSMQICFINRGHLDEMCHVRTMEACLKEKWDVKGIFF